MKLDKRMKTMVVNGMKIHIWMCLVVLRCGRRESDDKQ